MSDFATITFDATAPRELAGEWQTKNLPDDAELGCCICGVIQSDGKLIRDDRRGRFWNPTLQGDIRLIQFFGNGQLFCRFIDGVATIVRDWDAADRISASCGADWDDSRWLRI